MLVLEFVLLLLALICLLAYAFGVVSPRVNLMALGLAFWVVAVAVPVFRGVSRL